MMEYEHNSPRVQKKLHQKGPYNLHFDYKDIHDQNNESLSEEVSNMSYTCRRHFENSQLIHTQMIHPEMR
jgi:hypothetical protein